MIPTVTFYHSWRCPHCKWLDENVIRPLYIEGKIHLIKVDVSSPWFINRIKRIPSTSSQESHLHQDFIHLSNMGGMPVVPALKIEPPDYGLFGRQHEKDVIFLTPDLGKESTREAFAQLIREIIEGYTEKVYDVKYPYNVLRWRD